MKIHRYVLSFVTATTLAVSALTAPVAQAYELTVEGDVCTITYTPEDTLLLEQVLDESAEQIFSSLLSDLPGVSVDDLSLLLNHMGQDLPSVASFADSPAAETAARVNTVAVAAGFHDNEIFTVLQATQVPIVAATFMFILLPSEDVDGLLEPIVYTKDQIREMLATDDVTISEAFDELLPQPSEPAIRHLEQAIGLYERIMLILRAPQLECIGETPVTPVDPEPGDESPIPGGDNRGGSLSSFGSS